MPRFAANLSFLFTEADFLDRFALAAAAGFQAVEYMFPYEHEPGALLQRLNANGLEQVLINSPAGDWARGERGLAALPGRRPEFEASVSHAIDYARALDCPRIHLMAGIADGAEADRIFRGNLALACDEAAPHGIDICIEPINRRDIPGYFLCGTAQALGIIDDLNRPNLKLQFDCYHVQVMEGDVSTRLRAMLPKIGHIQIANPPGRHEPGEGELHYPHLFRLMDELGYAGWVGCEYKPKTTTAASFAWKP